MLTKRSSRICSDDIGRLIVEEQVRRDKQQKKRIVIPGVKRKRKSRLAFKR